MTYRGEIYIGSILLEPNRHKNNKVPTYRVSEWTEQFKQAGFDGVELWENHFVLADEAEQKAIIGMDFPVSVFNSYCGFDDASLPQRDRAAKAVIQTAAAGVKFNLGKDPALRDQYMRNVVAWAEHLPPECRLLCECHPGSVVEKPADAQRMFEELKGHGRFQAIVHAFWISPAELQEWFDHCGRWISHIHVQAQGAQPKTRARLSQQRDKSLEVLRILQENRFAGSFTLEFTQGANEPGETIEGMWEAAMDDLHFLRENWMHSRLEEDGPINLE